MNGVIYFLQDAVDKISVFSLSSLRVLREYLTGGSVPTPPPPFRRSYRYFVVVVGLVWSNDPAVA